MMETPVIVVLHGALGSAAQMAPVATALESLGRVVRVEFSGHGATPATSDANVSIAAFTDQLREVVARESQGAKPFVFGYSTRT
ncbi:MAG: alpha/beta hydrolase, partial [Gemmatimonas sp.]